MCMVTVFTSCNLPGRAMATLHMKASYLLLTRLKDLIPERILIPVMREVRQSGT